MGNWSTIQPPKCNAMKSFFSLSVPQTNRWQAASTYNEIKQAPPSIVCLVNVILDHSVLSLVDSNLFVSMIFFFIFFYYRIEAE